MNAQHHFDPYGGGYGEWAQLRQMNNRVIVWLFVFVASFAGSAYTLTQSSSAAMLLVMMAGASAFLTVYWYYQYLKLRKELRLRTPPRPGSRR